MTALSAAQLAKRWNCHRSSIYRGIRGGNIRTLDGFTPKRIPLSYVEAKEEEWRGGKCDSLYSEGAGTRRNKPKGVSEESRLEPQIGALPARF